MHEDYTLGRDGRQPPPLSSLTSVRSPGVFVDPRLLPRAQPFPLDVLPQPLRRFVEEGAAALNAPPDLIAVPLLTFLGSTIGNSLVIELKEGWEVRAVLYTAVVAPPGFTKTPRLLLARYPLEVLQREAGGRYEGELDAYNRQLAQWQG